MREKAGPFLKGFLLPLRASKLLLSTPRLRLPALLPFLVNILLFVLLFVFLVFVLLPRLDLASYSPEWAGRFGGWALTALKWVLGLALYAAGLIFGFTSIGMIVGSPFNDILSEKVETILRAKNGQSRLDWRSFLRETAACLTLSLKTAAKQGLLMLLLLPSLLLPFVGPLPIFLVGAYFQALGFLDVSMARHFLKRAHRQAGLSDKRWEIFGFGVAMSSLLLIPFMGLFVLPVGVTGGALLYCEIDWEEKWQQAQLTPPCSLSRSDR